MKRKIISLSIIAIFVAIALFLGQTISFADSETESQSPYFKLKYEFSDNVNLSQKEKEKFKAIAKLDVISGDQIVQSQSYLIEYGQELNIFNNQMVETPGLKYSLSINEINVGNWKLIVNGTDIGKNPYEFISDGTNFESIDAKFEIEPSNTSILINNINSDGELFPTMSEYVKEHYIYETRLLVFDLTTQEQLDLRLKFGESIDLIKEYPEFFKLGNKYNIIDTAKEPNGYIMRDKTECNGNIIEGNLISVDLTDNTNVNINLYGKIMGGIHRFSFEYDGDEEEAKDFASDYFNVRMNLTTIGTFEYVHYYRLIKDEDGNLTYVWVGISEEYDGSKPIEIPEGLEVYIRVNSGKHTDVIIPTGVGMEYFVLGNDVFQSGVWTGGSFHSSTGPCSYGLVRNWNFKYKNNYELKTFTKTDVEGNPIDASFEIGYDDINTKDRRKFIYEHFDSKTINGVEYKNVYEVRGSTSMDDKTDKSMINTEDGKFTLYYPLDYFRYFNYKGYSEGKDELNKLQKYELYLPATCDKLYIIEKQANTGFIVNKDVIEVETDNGENNVTIINKKKPTIKKIINGDFESDKEFIFNIFEKGSKEPIATVKVKANEEVALEPKVTDENGNTTGYLEDGKTYIIREEAVENFETEKIEGKHGTVNEDETSKYFEFTFDGSLDKLQDVVFYNKYNKVEEPTEEIVEEKEEIKQVQTGDVIRNVSTVLVIAIIAFGATYIKKKNK